MTDATDILERMRARVRSAPIGSRRRRDYEAAVAEIVRLRDLVKQRDDKPKDKP